MKHLETLHATSETQPQGSATSSMPPSCRNAETPRSTFATSARNTCNILMRHLKHVEHRLATCTNPVAQHECLLIAVTACPLPQAISLLLSAEGAAGASSRRELRARASSPPPHIEKKGRRRPWAAAAHPAVGARRGASGRGGRAPPPEESPPTPVVAGGGGSVCWRRRKKKREK
jgi:hypothetical protein